MAINFNTGPYYDDFDPLNNFYKVLFKPGYAVQARELNQMQSILQHQVAGIGNHLFRKNTMVQGNGVGLNTNADIVFVSNNSTITDLSVLVGRTITNASTFDYTDDATLDGYITAVVLGYRNAIDADATTGQEYIPACLYVKYFKGMTTAPYRNTFDLSETVKTVDENSLSFVTDSTFASGKGKVATIPPSIFYVNEYFVDCAQQNVIVEHDNNAITDASIVLKIDESIVTSNDDETLLDNANGAPNQYAPGADRYKISLTLDVVRDYNSDTFSSDRFILMLTIVSNVITYSNNRTEYAQLMKMLADRTYDANGNFIVDGLNTGLSLHPDVEYLSATVTPGRGYLGGYQYNQIADRLMPILKPRDVAHTEAVSNPGKFPTGLINMYVAGGTYAAELPEENTLVQILDVAPYVSGANVIGYAVYRGIQYITGSIGVDEIYKVYFDWVSLEPGHTINDVGGIKVIGSGQGVPVLHNLKVSGLTGLIAVNDVITSATVANVTGTVFHVSNVTNLYLLKDTQYEVPSTDVFTNGTATGTVKSYFVSNYTVDYLPVIEVDQDIIKTLYNSSGVNTTSYSYVKRSPFNVTVSQHVFSVSLETNETFEDFSTSDYYAYIVEDEVFIDNLVDYVSFNGTLTQLTFDVSTAGGIYDGKTIWLYSSVNKVNVAEAQKTLTTTTTQIVTPSSSYMSLAHQDVVKITKVVDGGVEAVTFQNTGDTVTLTDHGLENNEQVMFTSFSASNGLTAYKRYYVVNKTTNTFQVSLTSGGGAVAITTDTTGQLARPANIDDDTMDITTRYTMLSGNRGSFIGTGMIKLKKGATAPAGQIAVRYQYYSVDTGGYVSVDSYGDYQGDLDYIGEILDVATDKSDSVEIRRYLDFRTRTSSYYFKNLATITNGTAVLKVRDLNLTSVADTLVGKYVVGPGYLNGVTISSVAFNSTTGNTEITLGSNVTGDQKGSYYIGLNTADLSLVDTTAGGASYVYPKDQAVMSYSYVKFTPRKVLIHIDRSQQDDLTVQQVEVFKEEDIDAIRRSPYKLPLMLIHMDPYCLDLDDTVVTRYNNPVYQMLDIDKIKRRVDRAEYYTSLNMSQGDNQDRIDALSGHNQYANGFFSESFMNLEVQEYSSPDFKCTIVDNNCVMPQTVVRTVNLELDETVDPTTWQLHNTAITLPYTNVLVAANGAASKVNNLNPYSTVDWSSTGKLSIHPAIDNWFDVTIDGSAVYQPPAGPESSGSNAADDSKENTDKGKTKTRRKKEKENRVKKPEKQDKNHPKKETDPAPVLPEENKKGRDIITEINNLKVAYGPDVKGKNTRISFDWKTSKGRKGSVNTDMFLSHEIAKFGYDGVYAKSLINKEYNGDAKDYLKAGVEYNRHTLEWLIEHYHFKDDTDKKSTTNGKVV